MVEIVDKFLDAKKLFRNMFGAAKYLTKQPKVKKKKHVGRLLWNSGLNGTYVRKIHGELK